MHGARILVTHTNTYNNSSRCGPGLKKEGSAVKTITLTFVDSHKSKQFSDCICC